MKNCFRALAAIAAVGLALLPGCGSLKRLGTDVAVLVTAPVTIPLSAVYDSLDWGAETKDATPVLLAPLNIPLHAVKHCAYTVVYALDACVSPIYLLASITPRNDLQPIDLYKLNEGYPWHSAPWPAFEE